MQTKPHADAGHQKERVESGKSLKWQLILASSLRKRIAIKTVPFDLFPAASFMSNSSTTPQLLVRQGDKETGDRNMIPLSSTFIFQSFPGLCEILGSLNKD